MNEFGPSREWVIDQRMRDLIGKLVANTATDQDRAELHDLQRERVKLMTPSRLCRNHDEDAGRS